MSFPLIKNIEQQHLKLDRDNFGVGDRVKVHFKIVEGVTERIQLYEGIVLQRKGTGVTQTFTVRKISSGIGVERIFPVHSPRIEKIELVKKGKVRRAKLYYMRDRIGKAAMKVKEQFSSKTNH